jgi:Flp pilus assembly CpaF family ATPase
VTVQSNGHRPDGGARQRHAALIARICDEATDRLTERRRADEAIGAPPLDEADQRAFARQLINQALEAEARLAMAGHRETFPVADEDEIARAVHDLLFGLGPLQQLLDDPGIETINANGCDSVWVRHADGGRFQVEPIASSDDELIELIRLAAARFGLAERRFDLAAPLLDLRLPDGSRLFAAMAVVARPALSIRRHRFAKLDLDDLAERGTVTPSLRGFLGAAVRAGLNTLVCGETGAGKTTLVRALASEIPRDERLITIEDTLELGLDRDPERHANVTALEARPPNVEGEGEVTMAALVRAALRMDPDRVIVGEVRGDEVIPMLNAMSQGNDGSMCTIHANSSAGAFDKLATYAVQTPERLGLEATNLLIANAIDLVVHLAYDRASGRRVVDSVRDVTGADGPLVASNEVWRPSPDGRAVPGAPLRDQTLDRLVGAGFVPDWLGSSEWWR